MSKSASQRATEWNRNNPERRKQIRQKWDRNNPEYGRQKRVRLYHADLEKSRELGRIYRNTRRARLYDVPTIPYSETQ